MEVSMGSTPANVDPNDSQTEARPTGRRLRRLTNLRTELIVPYIILTLLIAMVGTDPVNGAPRFTFGRTELLDGVGVVPVAMGLFGIGEILLNAEAEAASIFEARIKSLIPSAQDLKDSVLPILRGTGIGCYFDDAFHNILGLRDDQFQSLYHFTIGGPMEDTRLITLPAYAHLSGRREIDLA